MKSGSKTLLLKGTSLCFLQAIWHPWYTCRTKPTRRFSSALLLGAIHWSVCPTHASCCQALNSAFRKLVVHLQLHWHLYQYSDQGGLIHFPSCFC